MKTFTNDQDVINVLPLSIVPLRTTSLRKARIVKNSRLEGMVELFSEKESGSGQIRPHDLPSVFEFHEDNEQDLDTVIRMCGLSSYDVYSLRVLLRHEGIKVDQHEQLRLSAEAQALLEPHMRAFTRPLVKAVYGHEDTHEKDLRGLIRLFADPDTDQARHNLLRIAEILAIELSELPTFLEDYCDVYLSLAYYQHYLEKIGPGLASFVETTSDLRARGRNTMSSAFLTACDRIERTMGAATIETRDILALFQTRTVDMWRNPSKVKFEEIRELIGEHQTVIGGNLCTLSVKLNAWVEKDRERGLGRDETTQQFILSEMLPGIDKITQISHSGTDLELVEL